LDTLALRSGDDAIWIGLTPSASGYWPMPPLNNDLYDGLAGVTLFLAYLGAISGEERYTRLARTASGTLRRRIEEQRSAITSIGAFNGWGGTIYTLSHLAILWVSPHCCAKPRT
jgi:lantibiotic modifying enzyme